MRHKTHESLMLGFIHTVLTYTKALVRKTEVWGEINDGSARTLAVLAVLQLLVDATSQVC